MGVITMNLQDKFAKIHNLEERFTKICKQIESIEDQMNILFNDQGNFDTQKIENKYYKLEDKKYDLEDLQGEIQNKIDQLENKLEK